MAPQIPTSEPTTAVAGSTWTWKASSADYPVSEGWVLSYRIAGLAVLTWSTDWISNDGATHTVAIPYSTTSQFDPGTYEFARVWTGAGAYAGERHIERLAPLTVQPDPTLAQAGDRATFAESNLAAVNAAITARLTGDEPVEYSIGNRSVKKMTIAELYTVRSRLQTEVWRLKNPGRGHRSLAVQFSRP